MTDTINGRTPEEIYKALRCVITQINDDCEDTCDSCKNCPNNFDGGRRELAVHLADAIVRIQQLERERDAAVEDARRSNNCKICKHNKKWGGDCEGWSLCGYNMPNWEWRGVQEVE